MNNIKTFTLEGKELKRAQKWIKKQKKKNGDHMGAAGGRFSYVFNPTGIGTGVSVIDNLTGKTKDVTDYDSF